MLVLGVPCQIIKSLFHKYIILLHPLYHPFSCYNKETSPAKDDWFCSILDSIYTDNVDDHLMIFGVSYTF